jgi:UDP-glucose 4-epimerase
LRYFNASGASKDGEIGEDHSPETHLIPNVILTGLKVNNYLSVFGNSFNTEDGTAVRDYIHVEDLAVAHARALEYLLKNQSGKSHKFNLGTGKGTSINQIIKITEDFLGVKIDVKYFDSRVGDPEILVADSTLAKNILKLDFNNSSIENIILTSINWLKRLHNEN